MTRITQPELALQYQSLNCYSSPFIVVLTWKVVIIDFRSWLVRKEHDWRLLEKLTVKEEKNNFSCKQKLQQLAIIPHKTLLIVGGGYYVKFLQSNIAQSEFSSAEVARLRLESFIRSMPSGVSLNPVTAARLIYKKEFKKNGQKQSCN